MNTEHQEALLSCAGDGAQVVHRHCGASLPGDLQNLSGCGHVQPPLCIPS